MKASVLVQLNDGSPTVPYRFKVFAVAVDFNGKKGQHKNVTQEVYERMVQGTIQNAARGVRNLPKLDFKGGYITANIKYSSPNAFYQYYLQFIHSCIPPMYTSVKGADCYVSPDEFESKTGLSVKIRKDADVRIGQAWVDYVIKHGSEARYAEAL